MIKIAVGKPGMGKTYFLVKKAYEFYRSGLDVYYNIPDLDFTRMKVKPFRNKQLGKLIYFTRLDQIINVKNGVIIMDECQIYMNARRWKDLPEQFEYKLAQHRHQHLDIWGSVQNVKRLDTVARELVNSCYFFKRLGKFFLWREYDIEDIDKVNKTVHSFGFYFLDKKLADCYNTYGSIDYK